MIGGLSAIDRFVADMEREVGATPAREWCERNAEAIHAAYLDMLAEREGEEVRS